MSRTPEEYFRQMAPPCVVAAYARAQGRAVSRTGAAIDLLGFVGDSWDGGETVESVSRALPADGDVTVRINSPGGILDEGLGIYNLLRGHAGKVRVEVLGVAASMASLIAMAGDTIVMHPGSYMMIHAPWAYVCGNAARLRDFADALDTQAEGLVSVYAQRTGQSAEEIRGMFARDTYLSAEECLDLGFATEVISAEKSTAPKTATTTKASSAEFRAAAFMAQARILS